jgi:hypothetical protein
MKKSTIAVLTAFSLGMSLVASCGQSSSKPLVGVLLANTTTTLNVAIGDDVTAKLGDTCTVQVQNAEDSSSTQISQINTFVTMGAKMLVVGPVEIGAISTALIAAREKGVKVVVNSASSAPDGCYDALTYSNEFLIGSYVALLAKHWAESTLAPKKFDTLILSSDLDQDGINRSNGMKTILEPYLKDKDGNYIDANGTVVTEDKKIANPAYSSLITTAGTVHYTTMGLGQTGNDLISAALTSYPETRLILAYMSGVSPQMSQYIIDNSATYNADEFGIFSGGVLGVEPQYLIGSLPEATAADGTKSCFRGAVSFGGDDAAMGLAELAYKVYNGKSGVDYQPKTSDKIGVWYTYKDDGTNPDTLACYTLADSNVKDFDPKTMLTNASTTIKWQGKKSA